LKVSFKLTEKDYINFNKFVFLQKKKIIWILIFGSFFALFDIVRHPSEIFMVNLIMFFYVEVIFFISYYAMSYVIAKLYAKKKDIKKSLLCETDVILNEEGLIENTALNRSFFRWNGIKSVETNKNYIFIFINSLSAIIIPKRFFCSDSQFNTFLYTAKLHYNKNK